MSQDFEFDLYEDSSSEQGKKTDKTSYTEAGHVRNVCFKWPDGKCRFYNYAYLISGEYDPETNAITLNFTSEAVIIEGSNLFALFEKLLEHKPKSITCTESRYSALANHNDTLISSITILQS